MGKSYEDRAKEAVADGTWLDVAWSNLSKDKFIGLLYECAGKADPQIAKDVARANNIRKGKPESWQYFTETSLPHMAPWFVANLHSDWWQNHLREPMRHGIDLGSPVIEKLAKSKEKDKIVPLLSASPYKEDRDAAFAYLAKAPEKYSGYDSYTLKPLDQLQIAVGFASQNDPRGDEYLTKALEKFAESAARPQEHDGFAMLTKALRDRRESDLASTWSTLLIHCLDRGLDTFVTLATLAQGKVSDEVRDTLTSWSAIRIDDTPQTRTMRVAAQAVLAQDNTVAKTISLDDARWLKANFHPIRYGWPGPEQYHEAIRLCAMVLLQIGDKEDLAWIASLANHSSPLLHEVADKAREALKLPPLARVYIDEQMVAHVEDTQGADGLFALLEDERSVQRNPIVKALAPLTADDDAHRDRLIEWSRNAIEGQLNYRLSYADDVPDDVRQALRFLKNLPEDLKQTQLSDSPSIWIQRECMGQDIPYPKAPEPSYQAQLDVKQLGEAAFGVGTQINGLAVSPSGEMLCSIGAEGGFLLDAESGAIQSSLDASGWGYDCAFTQDNRTVIACFHAGHVLSFDAQTGQRIASFNGHGGVPSGVRSLAISEENGVRRLATADDEGILIMWDLDTQKELWRHEVKGGFSKVIFLPDGRLLTGFYTKPRRGAKRSSLRLIDADGQAGKNFKQEGDVWAIALSDDGQIAFGGEGDEIIVGFLKGKTFKESQRLSLPKVTRLIWEGEDRLWACSQDGKLVCFSHLDTEPTTDEIGAFDAALWALAKHQHMTYTAGQIGSIAVSEGMSLPTAPAAHTKKIVSLLERSDGSLVSVDWDGKVLGWSSTLQDPHEIITLDATTEDAALVDDGIAIAGTRKGLRSIDLDNGEIIDSKEDGDDRVSIQGKILAYMDGATIEFAKPSLLKPGQRPAITVEYGDPESIALSPDGKQLVVGTSNGSVGLWQGNEPLWWRHDHGSDRLTQGHPHRDVCSVAFSPDSTMVASGATDNVARVYDAKDGTPLVRVQCNFGLFNRLAFDHESRRLAIPSSHMLTVVDLENKAISWRLTSADFDGKQVEVAKYLRDGRLVVGCATGELFVISEM